MEQSGEQAASVPRIIHFLWLQGLDDAPPIVRLNFERWARLNPKYELRFLDQSAVEYLLMDLPIQVNHVPPQALSDIIRAHLLATTGGIWTDASVFPVKPLDEWLPGHMTPSGFFAFERPGPDRPLSSWFIASTAQNSMMEAWRREVLKYWSVNRELREGIPEDPVAAVRDWREAYPYFWFHYLFQLLLDSDNEFARSWASCAKVSADKPHTMQGRLADDSPAILSELKGIAALAPVHKLNWRSPCPTGLLHLL